MSEAQRNERPLDRIVIPHGGYRTILILPRHGEEWDEAQRLQQRAYERTEKGSPVERRVRPESIDVRIRSALGGRTSGQYHELMRLVFPEDQFPRAFERSANGGPPGCAMAFNAALRRMGGTWHGMGQARTVYVPNAELSRRGTADAESKTAVEPRSA